jgi:hypothetical protein
VAHTGTASGRGFEPEKPAVSATTHTRGELERARMRSRRRPSIAVQQFHRVSRASLSPLRCSAVLACPAASLLPLRRPCTPAALKSARGIQQTDIQPFVHRQRFSPVPVSPALLPRVCLFSWSQVGLSVCAAQCAVPNTAQGRHKERKRTTRATKRKGGNEQDQVWWWVQSPATLDAHRESHALGPPEERRVGWWTDVGGSTTGRCAWRRTQWCRRLASGGVARCFSGACIGASCAPSIPLRWLRGDVAQRRPPFWSADHLCLHSCT